MKRMKHWLKNAAIGSTLPAGALTLFGVMTIDVDSIVPIITIAIGGGWLFFLLIVYWNDIVKEDWNEFKRRA